MNFKNFIKRNIVATKISICTLAILFFGRYTFFSILICGLVFFGYYLLNTTQQDFINRCKMILCKIKERLKEYAKNNKID